jgi:hypothetical protein
MVVAQSKFWKRLDLKEKHPKRAKICFWRCNFCIYLADAGIHIHLFDKELVLLNLIIDFFILFDMVYKYY